MLHISDEALDYWGDLFVAKNLSRYLEFRQFIVAPEANLQKILDGVIPARPAERTRAGSHVDIACDQLEDALNELATQVELQVAHLRRIDNGHCYQQLKHHAHGR